MPTATPTPITEPLIKIATADDLPTLPADLLYVKDGTLYLWDHQTNEQRSLLPTAAPTALGAAVALIPARFGPGPPLGTVRQVELSQHGQQVAAVVQALVQESGAVSDIVLLDLATNQAVTLVPNTHVAAGLTFSPDGKWLAYWADSEEIQARRSPGLGAPLPQITSDFWPAAVYIQQTSPPYVRKVLGRCSPPEGYACQSALHWARQGDRVMWFAGNNLWWADLQGKLAQTRAIELVAEPTLWSSHDNYLLGRMGSGYIEGSLWGIVTLSTGKRMEIPGTFEYVKRNAELAWALDENLLITWVGNPPLLQRLAVTGERLTVIEEVPMPLLLAANDTGFPTKPVQLADGRILLALVNANAQNPAGRGIYQVWAGVSTRLNGLPTAYHRQPDSTYFNFSGELFWSADGAGVIYYEPYTEYGYPAENLLYVPADGSALYDLKPILGDQPTNLLWVPLTDQ